MTERYLYPLIHRLLPIRAGWLVTLMGAVALSVVAAACWTISLLARVIVGVLS